MGVFISLAAVRAAELCLTYRMYPKKQALPYFFPRYIL